MIRQAHSYLVGAVSGASLDRGCRRRLRRARLGSGLPATGRSPGSAAAAEASTAAVAPAGRRLRLGIRDRRGTPSSRRLGTRALRAATRRRSGRQRGLGGGAAAPNAPSAGSPTSGLRRQVGGSEPARRSIHRRRSGGGGSVIGAFGRRRQRRRWQRRLSATVANTVNNTVSQVDERPLGGALGETGVTEVTQGVVNGVAGPESPVGHAVDETRRRGRRLAPSPSLTGGQRPNRHNARPMAERGQAGRAGGPGRGVAGLPGGEPRQRARASRGRRLRHGRAGRRARHAGLRLRRGRHARPRPRLPRRVRAPRRRVRGPLRQQVAALHRRLPAVRRGGALGRRRLRRRAAHGAARRLRPRPHPHARQQQDRRGDPLRGRARASAT